MALQEFLFIFVAVLIALMYSCATVPSVLNDDDEVYVVIVYEAFAFEQLGLVSDNARLN